MNDSRTIQDDTLNPIARVGIGNSEGGVVIDNISRGIKTISALHQEIHAGHAFIISLLATNVADDANVDLFIAVGSKELHMTFAGGAAGDAWGFLYENATHSSGGSNAVAYNRHRASTNTSTATFTYGGTNSIATATALISQNVPGGTKNQATGGDSDEREEIILKVNTNYLARMTNKSGGVDSFSIKISWYEEDPL